MFTLVKVLNGRTPVPEIVLMPTKAEETYVRGEALIVSSGAVTKCPTTSEPQYISEEDYTAPATGQRAIRCFLVESNQLWEAPVDFSATPVALVLGTKLEIDTSGLGVTDVTTSGVATLFDVLDADDDDGDTVIVRFE
jgi:hypothetical protein